MEVEQTNPQEVNKVVSPSKNELIRTTALVEKYVPTIIYAQKLNFKGVFGKDVYNIAAPFVDNGKEYIAGRVESTKSETDSKIMFFMRDGDYWTLDKKAPVFELQDPFITKINGKLMLGGVKVEIDPKEKDLIYYTQIYLGKDLHSLKKWVQGPLRMKDIRPVQLGTEIGVFTRPQGDIGGKGRIGFFIARSPEHLSLIPKNDYYFARLLDAYIPESEWMGANAAYPLANGMIGVLAHIAYGPEHDKNYYPITFAYNPATNKVIGIKIIAQRADLPEGKSKRPALQNVIFPGGLIRNPDRTANLYIGAGDAEAYELLIEDPFLEYETL